MTPTPHTILAIDAGALSGWALGINGFRVDSGETHPLEAAKVVERVVKAAGERALIVVGERWTRHGMHAEAYGGLIAAWKAWTWALEAAGHHPKRVVRVYPQSWRAAVLGRGNLRTEEARKLSIAVARGRWKLEREPGHDEAAALCMLMWGMHAPEVEKAAAFKPRKIAPKGAP